ncbi:hypothetical protein P7C73_g2704, partial [Tremellales sp. Uapishka_1]
MAGFPVIYLQIRVHKWRKGWIVPSGLQAESSYKICKWIRIDDVTNKASPNSETGDEFTPAPDGDDEDMEEDEGELEGEDEENGDEGEIPLTDTAVPTEAPNPLETPTPLETPDTDLPSNAIQMTNTAPQHTEVGAGDLGAAGIEITLPGDIGTSVEQDKMEVDVEVRDEGLVMGDMEAPIPELAIVGGDEPPKEVESA